MFKKYLKVFLVFVFCFKYAFSIKCFECSSHNNSMCLDPYSYDEETLRKFLPVTTCSHGVYTNDNHDFFCRKIVQTIFHKHYEPDVRVTRTCGWVRHHRECYKADNEDHLETVCQCFTDKCNSSTRLTSAVHLLIVGMIGLKTYISLVL